MDKISVGRRGVPEIMAALLCLIVAWSAYGRSPEGAQVSGDEGVSVWGTGSIPCEGDDCLDLDGDDLYGWEDPDDHDVDSDDDGLWDPIDFGEVGTGCGGDHLRDPQKVAGANVIFVDPCSPVTRAEATRADGRDPARALPSLAELNGAVQAGDIVYLRDGVHYYPGTGELPSAATEDAFPEPITIMPYPGEQATVTRMRKAGNWSYHTTRRDGVNSFRIYSRTFEQEYYAVMCDDDAMTGRNGSHWRVFGDTISNVTAQGDPSPGQFYTMGPQDSQFALYANQYPDDTTTTVYACLPDGDDRDDEDDDPADHVMYVGHKAIFQVGHAYANYHIQGLTIRHGCSGASIRNIAKVRFTDCVFKDIYGAGIWCGAELEGTPIRSEVINCTFSNIGSTSLDHGVYSCGTMRIEGCTFQKISGGGVKLAGDGDIAVNNTFYSAKSLVHNPDTGRLGIYAGRNSVVANNVIYGDMRVGIFLFPTRLGGIIANNVIHGSRYASFLLYGDSAGYTIANNITMVDEDHVPPQLVAQTSAALAADLTWRRNLWYVGCSGVTLPDDFPRTDPESFYPEDDVDPRFMNPRLGGFRLQAGSPAIDAGRDASVPVGVDSDFEGRPRFLGRAVDLGANEYDGPRINAIVSVVEHDETAYGVDVLHRPGCWPRPVECRVLRGQLELNFEFDADVETLPGGCSVTSTQGSASVVTPITGNTVTVRVDSLNNLDSLDVTLAGLVRSDGSGHATSASARLSLLAGDMNSTGIVDIHDLLSIRNLIGQPVDATNFKYDVFPDGVFDQADWNILRNALNTSLPEVCQ